MNPGMKLGPFTIEDEIGSGAMGAVYRAQYRDKALRVAIKVMAPNVGSSATAQARFQRESEILKQLQHPNIVRLLAVGQYKKSPFYAMEYIQGEPLDEVLARRGRLPWEEVVRLGQQLCAALQHAHDKGIVHRDLKPSNLMILPDGTLKLTDFGIAKVLDMTGLTATNCTVGTASYMSPEQCKGDRDIGHKSDLYSMGVMFYELVTGKKPFFAESTMDMFMQHVKGKFRRPSDLVPDIPVWLDNLICQLLEKKPDDRPLSARVVGESLAEVLEKVEAQKSAGLERATSRDGETVKNRPRLDDTDREAARAMLGKKKKKKKKTPIYQQGWFTIAALILVLGGMAFGLFYVFFTAPSLESLHAEIARANEQSDFMNWRAAQDGPIRDFYAHYRDSDEPLARKVHEMADEINSRVLEHQMLNRWYSNIPPDDKGERHARLALEQEDLGKMSEAMTNWKNLTDKQLKDPDPDKHAWALIGQRRLKQLQDFAKQWDALYDRISYDKAYEAKSPEEELAVKAFRAELEGKTGAARKLWEDLKFETKESDPQRSWFLLASYQLYMMNRETKGK